jgi:hypothetical protein
VRSVKNYVIFLLSCTTVGAGYLAWHQTRELEVLRQLAPADDARAELRRRVWNERKAAGPPEISPAANPPAIGEISDPAPAVSDRGRRGEGAFMRMMEDPDYQILINLSQKGMLDGRYAALFKQLSLTPAQLEQFKELLVEKQSALMDVLAAARAQGLDPRTDRDAVRQLIATTQAEIDGNIRAAVGETAFAEYQEYERTLPYRGVVGQLEQRLSYTAAPLTTDQNRQMIDILAETGRTGRNNPPQAAAAGIRLGGPLAHAGSMGSANSLTVFAGGGVMITDATVNRAQSVLSPVQLSALQEVQQEQQAAAQLGRTLRTEFGPKNRSAPDGATGTPPSP